MEQWWNYIDGKSQRRKTCLSANLSRTNSMWTALGVNPGLRDEKLVTNHLCCGMTPCNIHMHLFAYAEETEYVHLSDIYNQYPFFASYCGVVIYKRNKESITHNIK
jgi:hypothetical protein